MAAPKGVAKDYNCLLAEEEMILDVTEEICRIMEQRGVNRTHLAQRLSCKQPHITQLLNGERNMTLRTLNRIAYSLGHRVKVEFVPEEKA